MLATTLPNGMRVLVDEYSPSDVVAAYLWFNVGSRDERPGMEGAAHFVEHMLFKGTRRFGVGEVARAVEALGGDINAYTSFDETVFHITAPGGALDDMLGVLAEMGQSARFDREELERERDVICEEIRGGADDPDMVVSEALFADAFPGDPYGRPIIGTVQSVRAMSRDDLYAFYREHYAPANACLAVSGRVRERDVLTTVSRLFDAPGRAPARLTTPAAPRRGGSQRTLVRRFAARLAEIAFPAPAYGHPDVPALHVLAAVLGGGTSSPLGARVRRAGIGCLSATMQFDVQTRGGVLVVSLACEPRGLEPSLSAARAVIAEAAAGRIDADDVARARSRMVASRVFDRETVDGRAHGLCFDQEVSGDPEAWRAFDAALRAVQHADVVRVAAAYLRKDDAIELTLVPKKSRLTTTWPDAGPVQSGAGPTLHTLPNGLRVLLDPDGGEVVAMRIVGFGGALAERPGTCGRLAAWAQVAAVASGGRNAMAVSRAVERLGGGLGGSGGRSSQGIRAEFPAEHAEAGLDLFLDAVLAAEFPEAEVDRVRGELLAALAERDDSPELRVAERIWSLACPHHPWALPMSGTERGISGLDGDALRRLHRRWLTAGNLVVCVTGGFDPGLMLERLQDRLCHVPAGSWTPCPTPPAHPEQTRRDRIRSGREQAHVAMAFAAPAVHDPDQIPSEVLTAILGGQSGRLFLELREAHGLAYAVGAGAMSGVHPGLLICSLATDPARAAEAESRLTEVLGALRDGAIRHDEVDRARSSILGGWETEMQTASARAAEAAVAELYGLGGTSYRQNVRKVQTVTVSDVQRVAARVLARPLAVVSLVPR